MHAEVEFPRAPCLCLTLEFELILSLLPGPGPAMTSRPITVLIAEDDPVFRRVISFTLSRCSLAVEAVGDGDAAYRRLREGGIDFLVTDHQMPICSGLELIERLQRQ